MKIYFVGAALAIRASDHEGPAAPDRRARVHPRRIARQPADSRSAGPVGRAPRLGALTLDQIVTLFEDAHRRELDVVRLHTGEPAIYGAIGEQMDACDAWESRMRLSQALAHFKRLPRRSGSS